MAGHEIALSANLFERCKNARAAGKQKGITFMTHRFVQKWWSMYTPKLSILLKAYEKIYLEYIYIYYNIFQSLGVLGIPHDKRNCIDCIAQALQMLFNRDMMHNNDMNMHRGSTSEVESA